MTEEDKKKAESEIIEVVKWLNIESKRISVELDNKFGLERKIDGNREAYKELHKEFARRMKIIGEKYKDLPPDTEINFKG